MRLGKRERAAKRERLAALAARVARVQAVTGPRLPTGFNRWPVGRPSVSWGWSLTQRPGAPAIRPFWKATRLQHKTGSAQLYKDATILLEG